MWSAGWYWDKNKLNKYADKDDIFILTRRINGGYNGFLDRIDKLIMLYIEFNVPDIEKRINNIFDRIVNNIREPIADKRLFKAVPNLLKMEKLRNEYLQKIGVKSLYGDN